MNQDQFERKYEPEWKALESWLTSLKGNHESETPVEEIPGRYRRLAQHLSLARERLYSPRLIDRLALLAQGCHNALYRERSNLLSRAVRFYLITLPQTVRDQWRLVLLSAALFFGPLIGMLILVQYQPEMAYSVVGNSELSSMEASYGPGDKEEREAQDSFIMLGFYISNNTGIGFRTFAGGLLFGIGSLAILLLNGLVIGAVAGHVTHLGYIESFWGFVAGHSAPELSAIVLSGAAGFRLGWAVIAPGRKTRRQALRDAGRIAVRLVYGAATLFIVAAFVEAFWSPPSFVPVTVKYVVGLLGWVVLLAYLLMAGRSSHAR